MCLLITGSAKLWSGFGHAKLLAIDDPIFGITFGHLMLLVGLIEAIAALVILQMEDRTLAAALVAWLATGFLAYRTGLWLAGWHRPCACLGNLTDALHVSPELADNAAKLLLVYLLIGSYASVFHHWKRRRGSK